MYFTAFVITSAKEVMFLSALVSWLVCLLISRITQNYSTDFRTKFGGKLAHGPREKPLDFGVIRITLRYVRMRVGLRRQLRLGVARDMGVFYRAFVS